MPTVRQRSTWTLRSSTPPNDVVADATATGADLVVERTTTVEWLMQGVDRSALDSRCG